MSVESEKNNSRVLKKLDNPVKKNPKPPKLTVNAQKMLFNLLDPVKSDRIREPDFICTTITCVP